jgi:hypothetical protein
MTRPRLVIKPSSEMTRLLLTVEDREVLRAVLPRPTTIHSRAADSLLEGLSLWLSRKLFVVLCADAEGASSALGLCDGFGFGRETVYFEVEVVEPGRRRRGLGSFRDLHQFGLRGVR